MDNIKFDNYSKPPLFAYINTTFLVVGIAVLFTVNFAVGFVSAGLGFVGSTYGRRTVLHFDKNMITKFNTLMFRSFGGYKQYIGSNYNTAVLQYRSDLEVLQARVGSVATRKKEYHIILFSTKTGKRLHLGYYNDYQKAKDLLVRFKNEWGYKMDDQLSKKIQKNKELRNNRKSRK